MSGVCKACNKVLSSSEIYTRKVELPDGTIYRVLEDLCKRCRDMCYVNYEDDTTQTISETIGERDEKDADNMW